MSARGVFGVSREIWDDPDFADEPFTEREAWLWLIGAAAWRDETVRGNHGRAITLARGEFSFSVRYLSDRWKWSKSAVDRFFQKLKKRDTIGVCDRDGAQVYFINKYNKYQIVGIPDRDTIRDTIREDSGTNKKKGKIEEDKGSLRSPCPVEVSEPGLFEAGQLAPIAKPAAQPQGDHERFVDFWQTYPKRLGTNSRKEASAKFSRAVKAGADPSEIINGAARYAAHCDETGKTSTDKVQQATTWLNQQNWETDYGRQQRNQRQQNNGTAAKGNATVANVFDYFEDRRNRFTDPVTGTFDERAADIADREDMDRRFAEFFPATFGRVSR